MSIIPIKFRIMTQTLGNEWFHIDGTHLQVYIRWGIHRHINNKLCTNVIDLANIVVEDGYRNRGEFTGFLNEIEFFAQENCHTIFVENILNDRFLNFLTQKKGYIITGDKKLPSVYKFPKKHEPIPEQIKTCQSSK